MEGDRKRGDYRKGSGSGWETVLMKDTGVIVQNVKAGKIKEACL